MLYDAEGFVIGTGSCPQPPPPWIKTESKRYPGRWFFHNRITDESVWRLPPWDPEAVSQDPVRMAQEQSQSSSVHEGVAFGSGGEGRQGGQCWKGPTEGSMPGPFVDGLGLPGAQSGETSEHAAWRARQDAQSVGRPWHV